MFDGTKDTIDIPRARFTESNALSVSVPVNLPGRIGLMIFLPETNNASAFVDPGRRRLVTGTYDGSDIRLYIDGTLRSTTHCLGTISGEDLSLQGLQVGYFNDGYRACSVGELRMCDRALSEQEIRALYSFRD